MTDRQYWALFKLYFDYPEAFESLDISYQVAYMLEYNRRIEQHTS